MRRYSRLTLWGCSEVDSTGFNQLPTCDGHHTKTGVVEELDVDEASRAKLNLFKAPMS